MSAPLLSWTGLLLSPSNSGPTVIFIIAFYHSIIEGLFRYFYYILLSVPCDCLRRSFVLKALNVYSKTMTGLAKEGGEAKYCLLRIFAFILIFGYQKCQKYNQETNHIFRTPRYPQDELCFFFLQGFAIQAHD